jgi:Sec-independent protein translocase protein TatA
MSSFSSGLGCAFIIIIVIIIVLVLVLGDVLPALSRRTAAYFIEGRTEIKKLTTRSIEDEHDEDDYERAAPGSSPAEQKLIPTEHTQPVTTKANGQSAFVRLAPKRR